MNSFKLIITAVTASLLLVMGMSALHQTATAEEASGEVINWQVLSSGGTNGSSTNFQLTGTVAQTAVSEGNSTNFIVKHGYWQTFGAVTCCNHDGIRGDANYDLALNVADLTYLVNYLFKGGAAPPCPEEGDVDGGGSINVADLTYLVNYLFKGGPSPASC